MSKRQWLEGSVTAPAGFRAAGVAAGIKPSGRPDVALIASDRPSSSAAIFTQNVVAAAPVVQSRQVAGRGRAIIVNAGNANCCTGEQGLRHAARMAELTGELLQAAPGEIFVASTGVIGRPLPMERLESGIREAAASLSPGGGDQAADAILTTDTRRKSCAVELDHAGLPCRIGGIAKGSGMIQPQMATMLAFVTSDAEVEPGLLQELLRQAAAVSFNRITVDGDTSTNDTLVLLANGASGLKIERGSAACETFLSGLVDVCTLLAREIARDGEGATRLIEVLVSGAESNDDAEIIARSIANSLLVKTAIFGNDPNWGRILMAAGKSGAVFSPNHASLQVAGVPLFRTGEPLPFDPEAASGAMKQDEVKIDFTAGTGPGVAAVWTCDLSYDYVRINAEYTT